MTTKLGSKKSRRKPRTMAGSLGAALLEAALRERAEDAVPKANRAEAAWLHALRCSRGQADDAGAKALRGTDRDVYRYLAAPRGEGERFAVAPRVPPKVDGAHHVELAEALRSPAARESCAAVRVHLEAARWDFAAAYLCGLVVRVGLVEDGIPAATLARVEADLKRLDPAEADDSRLIRIALTHVLGWTVDKAKQAARRTYDLSSTKSDANKRRRET